jgi:hypothetical protein
MCSKKPYFGIIALLLSFMKKQQQQNNNDGAPQSGNPLSHLSIKWRRRDAGFAPKERRR